MEMGTSMYKGGGMGRVEKQRKKEKKGEVEEGYIMVTAQF